MDGDSDGGSNEHGNKPSESAAKAATTTANSSSISTARNPKGMTVDTSVGNGSTRPTPQPSPSPTGTNAIIDEKIGCCLEEFRCQHNNFTGILYVGPLGLVFLGRFLLFEWTVVLKWEEVKKVKSKNSTPTSFRNSGTNAVVRIETSAADPSKSGGVYDFEGFFDPQKALETLIGLHNDSLLDNDENNMSQIITKRGSVIPLRRSNSNPAEQISSIFNFDDDGDNVHNNNNNNKAPAVFAEANPNRTTMLDLRDQYSATNKKALQKIAAASPRVDAPVQEQSNGCDRTPSTKPSPEQLVAAWSNLCSDIAKYPEAPVVDKEVALDDLDSFVETFVGDAATYSWSKFMTDVVGDLNVSATEWTESETENSSEEPAVPSLTRTIEYTHPVNAPMAPPTARARKEQTLKRYGNENGLVVETKTVVSDVPMTDCFYVRDIVQVKKSANKFVVNIRFDIVFVKSTYFRSLIARTTASEFNTFMTDLASWFVDHCGSSNSMVDPPTKDPETSKEGEPIVSKPSEAIPQTTRSSTTTTPSTIVSTSDIDKFEFGSKILILCLLLWMMQMQYQLSKENKSLKDDLREVKSIMMGLEKKQSTEAKLLREEWKEWKATLVQLEEKRSKETESFRSDLSELQSTLLEHETSRVSETQTLWEDLLEWKSSLLRASSDSGCPSKSDTCSESEEEALTDDFEDGPASRKVSIPRQETASGIGGPLKVEPLQQRGGYRNVGQKPSATLDELNDWGKLEECSDCY